MPNPVVALIGAGSALLGAKEQKSAAKTAANAQIAGDQASIAEQQRQFDAIRQLLAPYTDAGKTAVGAQQDLLGLGAPGSQQAAIDALQSSPQMQTMLQQGENSILQNASATGGLRGGNTQAALAQFRPQLLNQLIQQQYQNLGGLTAVGQNAAAGVGNAGMQTAANIGQSYQNQGAAQAGQALAAGQANAGLFGGLANMAGTYGMMKALGKF